MFLDDYSTSYINKIMQINYKLFETHFVLSKKLHMYGLK